VLHVEADMRREDMSNLTCHVSHSITPGKGPEESEVAAITHEQVSELVWFRHLPAQP